LAGGAGSGEPRPPLRKEVVGDYRKKLLLTGARGDIGD
jgi:hypothetical protein